MALVEFGQEVGGTRLLSLVKIAHNVGLLLPDMDCFLKLHFPLVVKDKWKMLQHTPEAYFLSANCDWIVNETSPRAK